MTDFNVIIEKGEDGYYISEVIELPGCHSQAKTIDELIERTKEAISLYLEEEREDAKVNFIGLQKIEVKDEQIRQSGSHIFLRHEDGRTTVVPNHPGEKLDRGLLNKILRKDIKISREKFEEFL